MREVGFGVRQEIDVLASVSRGCQESGLARSVPREESAEGWLREGWLVAGSWGLGGLKLAGDFIRASWRKRIQPGWSCPGRGAKSQAPPPRLLPR